MTNQERLQLIKANENKIAEIRVKRNEIMKQILKLYEKERRKKK